MSENLNIDVMKDDNKINYYQLLIIIPIIYF